MTQYKKRQSRKRRQKSIGKLVLNLIRTPLLAACTASLILLFKAPADLPEMPSEDDLLDAPMIGVDLQGLVTSPVQRKVVYTEKQVNGFLSRSVRGNNKEDEMQVALVNTMAGFEPGLVRVLMTIKVYIVPITAQTTRKVSLEDGKLQSEVVGLQIGSLPIHPSINAVAGGIFGKLWEALSQEKKLLERMESVTFGEKQVEIVGGGPMQ